ncbi:MAG: TolC family protein [Candidatus Margulisiibacteriota bacterium]|nr:TolC family protein [Candidatus Margulisiibacteriota bacterium]
MNRSIVTIMISVFLFLAQPGFALTLNACIESALAKNETILYHQQQVKEAEFKATEKNAALLPSFSLSAGYTRLPYVSPSKASMLGSSLDDYSASFTLSQPLYAGGSLFADKAKVEVELAQARDSFKNAKNKLYFDVVSAYYTARQGQEVLTAKEAFLKNLQAFYLRSKNLYDRTKSPRLEALLQIEVQVGNAAQDVEIAKNNYQKAIRALLELIYQDNEKVELSDSLPLVISDIGPMDIQNNYEYCQGSFDLKAAEHDEVIYRSALLPELNLSAYYGWEWATWPPADGYSQWAVSLELLLFDFMGTAAKADQAKSIYQQKLTSLNILKRSLKKLYTNTADDLRSAGARLKLSKANLTKAEESLKLYQQRYASYTVNSRELLDAEQAALQAKMNCLSALLDYNLARIELHRLRGEARL